MSTVRLEDRRIIIDGRPGDLAGEVHYFRLARADWADRLDQCGLRWAAPLASYIPWLCHELPDGTIDLTGRTPTSATWALSSTWRTDAG